jgi:hypothetical protein
MDRQIPLLTLALLLLAASPSAAQEQTEMTLALAHDGSAHVTILSKDVPNPEDLKTVIRQPKIKGIYEERFSALFGPVENLTLVLEGSDLRIEFDAPSIATEQENEWIIEGKEFKGKMAPVAVLRVELPEGAKWTFVEPEPDEGASDPLTWHNADFLPAVSYEEGRSLRLPVLLALLALAAIVFLSKRRISS